MVPCLVIITVEFFSEPEIFATLHQFSPSYVATYIMPIVPFMDVSKVFYIQRPSSKVSKIASQLTKK